MAIKAAETDALKRACRTFGNYLGLACYKDKTKFNAPKDNEERGAQIAELMEEEQQELSNQNKVSCEREWLLNPWTICAKNQP